MENRFKAPQRERRPLFKWPTRWRLFSQGTTNSANQTPDETQRTKSKSDRRIKPVAFAGSLLDGSLLMNKWVSGNIPYIIFLAVLAVFYISNSATAERNRRDAVKLEEELKELRYKYISTKSSVMYLSNPSQISDKLKETGITDNLVPPVKIFVTQDETKP